MSDNLDEILEDYKKMRLLRRVAEKHPDGTIDLIIKIVDEEWNKEHKN